MLSSYWKDRITKEFRAGEKSIEQMVADYGHSEKVIKDILFPDKKNRGKITDAVVKVAPPVRFPVKKGLTIVAGKDPRWVEAGKKAHVTKLKNLKKEEELDRMGKILGIPSEMVEKINPTYTQEKKTQTLVDVTLEKLKQLEQIPVSGLNRKQRKELTKQKQAMRIELGRKIYTEPTPQQVVEMTIGTISGNSSIPDKPKRKYAKKVKIEEPVTNTVSPAPDVQPLVERPIEEVRQIEETLRKMRDTPYTHELPKERKKANVLAAEHMINSAKQLLEPAMTLLMEAIKLLKKEE